MRSSSLLLSEPDSNLRRCLAGFPAFGPAASAVKLLDED
jgi:hypothetical protein